MYNSFVFINECEVVLSDLYEQDFLFLIMYRYVFWYFEDFQVIIFSKVEFFLFYVEVLDDNMLVYELYYE